MSKKADRLLLFLYLTGFVVIAATIALFQPLADTMPQMANPPDEHARFMVPWYICQHGTIPTGFEEEIRIPSYGFSYGLYNVFPYIVQGYLMRLASFFTDSKLILLYVARFVNVASGTCMAYVVYLLSCKLFQAAGFGWAFCFAVMYLPQSLFLHTYVNTDSMCLLSVAMMLYGLVSAYREGFTRVNCLWVCCGIILCALSYYNAYGYILSCSLLFAAYFLQRKEGRWTYDWRKMLKKGIFISVIVLAGISWWFIRSYILYDGDFLGLATREKMAIEYASPEVNPLTMSTYENRGYTILEMMRENNFLESVFYSFVAAFGSMTITANIWIYRLYKVFFAAGLLSCVFLSFPILSGKTEQSSTRTDSLSALTVSSRTLSGWKQIFFHINMIFCILMPMFLLLRYAYTMDFQTQGRYLMPALIPLMYYTIRGFEKLAAFKLWRTWPTKVLVLLLVLLPLLSTLWMTYCAALPIYLKTGVALE
ncbi:MAG: hypothetical protein IJZ34_01295 [Lachnospiraceae bacterium]|nr:hypothetical protein [Lachnospiraceae bacterium]